MRITARVLRGLLVGHWQKAKPCTKIGVDWRKIQYSRRSCSTSSFLLCLRVEFIARKSVVNGDAMIQYNYKPGFKLLLP